MDAIPFLRRRRKRHSSKRLKKENMQTRGVIAVGLALAGGIGGLIFALAFVYASLTADLQKPESILSLMDPVNGSLMQPTRIYDRTGEHQLLSLSPQEGARTYVPIDSNQPNHLPESLTRITIALEDPGFWREPGYHLEDIFNPYSHPTLAQKLVSDLLLWNEPPSLRRAIRERYMAAQLTAQYGREKILEWYLNSADFGHYAYGAEAAALLYFGKPVSKINLGEAAILITVNQSPAINPLDAPEAVLQRQRDVLELLKSEDAITTDEFNQTRQSSIKFIEAPKVQNAAPSLLALALSQLENQFKNTRIERGGMHILTTLDYELEMRANCALQTQLSEDDNKETSTLACSGSESLPPLPPGQNPPLSASAVVLEPQSGQILALIGDANKNSDPQFLTPHRPGSLLTPFVYLAGFTRGLSPATLMWDLPQENPGTTSSGHTFLGPVRLRTAMTSDSLSTASQVFNQMGSGLVQQTMAPFGLDIPATNLKALLEADSRFTVVQMARAYGIFAAEGKLAGQPWGDHLVPTAILAVKDLNNQTIADWSTATTTQIVSAQLAYLVTDVFNANMAELGRPAVLKTGLTPDGLEAWAAGYTPQRAVVVWMTGKSLTQRPAVDLWSAIMLSANRKLPPDNWPLPAGMQKIKVCDPSGMLPTAACPNVVDEIFIDGFQPTQADNLFKSYSINHETGLLATVFTPEQLIEKHVFMNVPPEAQAWAKSINLPVPPTQYDNIQPPSPNPEANISTPGMFSKLGGQVMILGAASGTGFSYYRLQYGQGLNPESWVQIGSDINTPVVLGKLGEWDTTGLSGLYTLQLLVVRTDHSLQKANVQVTIFNQ